MSQFTKNEKNRILFNIKCLHEEICKMFLDKSKNIVAKMVFMNIFWNVARKVCVYFSCPKNLVFP